MGYKPVDFGRAVVIGTPQKELNLDDCKIHRSYSKEVAGEKWIITECRVHKVHFSIFVERRIDTVSNPLNADGPTVVHRITQADGVMPTFHDIDTCIALIRALTGDYSIVPSPEITFPEKRIVQ